MITKQRNPGSRGYCAPSSSLSGVAALPSRVYSRLIVVQLSVEIDSNKSFLFHKQNFRRRITSGFLFILMRLKFRSSIARLDVREFVCPIIGAGAHQFLNISHVVGQISEYNFIII